MKIQGLVLAAGSSTRCGTNKLLMPAKGSAIIERTVRTLIKANLAGITVVLGSCSEEIKKYLMVIRCSLFTIPIIKMV